MNFKIYNDSIKNSGNNQTLNRLSNILYLPITNRIENNIIGINAYKFGKKVINKNINYILIIGGTDINIDFQNSEKRKIIIEALRQSLVIICFTSYFRKKILELNINNNKIFIIKQSVPKLICSDFNLKKHLNINPEKIFLIVGNLRPVKNQMMLNNLFKFLYNNYNYVLVIIGDIISGEYSFPEGVYHIKGVNKNIVYSCIKQSDGLINTSLSEGMSLAIIEAMKLKCIVYAINTIHNRFLISNNFNGFLFLKFKLLIIDKYLFFSSLQL